MEKMNIYQKLIKIQNELKAPKNQYSKFGKYHYRSCEDILEGLKPLLEKYKTAMFISDEVVNVGNRFYIQATVTLIDVETDSDNTIMNKALAREEECTKKMDVSQITGASSSYARKYALNGMFAIDDTKDADTDSFKRYSEKQQEPQKTSSPKQEPNPLKKAIDCIIKLSNGKEEYLDQLLKEHNKKDLIDCTKEELKDIHEKMKK